MDFDSYGKWIGGCGKFFMFSKKKVLFSLGMAHILNYHHLISQANLTVARDVCCSIGLTLAVIPTMGKKKCMDKIIQSKVGEAFFANSLDGILDDFWLYGTDNGCSPGNMHWCSNFKQFQPKEVNWAVGEPKKGNCVYLKSSNSSSSLATEDCSKEMRFLCDVRKKGTEGMAMQQECLETWDVTAG
jgi:Lectin C-type domain